MSKKIHKVPININQEKRCSTPWCQGEPKPHYDNGLYCGDDMCDECFEKMKSECRKRSW